MIGLVIKGEGVRGLMNYLQARRDDSMILATDLLGSTPREFARQFRDVYALRDRALAAPVAHLILRPAEGEDLSDAEWEEALSLTLAQMGYGNSPHVAYLHDHGDGRHLHICTLRIAYDGSTISDSNDQYRIMSVARELEKRFGLQRPQERRGGRLSKAELRRHLNDPQRANRVAALRETIDRAAESSRTLREFCSRLERLGIQTLIKVARTTGIAQGITFTISRDGTEEIFKGSDVGKRYSLAAIVNRHELLLNHRPTGPILAITELTRREVETLRRDGLAPDALASTGSRSTGYWHLPESASGFSDLLASRLPHRIQSFVDSPAASAKASEIAPQVLERRELQAELAALIAEPQASAALAPTLPPSLLSALQGDMAADLAYVQQLASERLSTWDITRVARLCNDLSERLTSAADRGLVSHGSLDLRATYHLLVSLALRQSEPDSLTRGKDTLLHHLTGSDGLESHRPPEDIHHTNDADLTPGKDRGAADLLDSKLSPGKDQDSSRAGDTRLSPGKDLVAVAPPASLFSGRHEELGAESDRLALDLLAAFDRYTADPNETHAREFRAAQRAFEDVARHFDRLPSREPLPQASAATLADLRTSLLHSQDHYFSAPSPETEREWRTVRARYLRLAEGSRVTSPQPGGLTLREARTGFGQARSNATATERLHLTDPRPSTRHRWLEALKDLDRAERLYGAALRTESRDLAETLRASARHLSLAEAVYFRSPNPTTRARWISAVEEHGREDSSLAAVRVEAHSLRTQSPAGQRRDSRRDVLAAESNRLLRYFERALAEKVSPARLLRQLEPQRLASRLATTAGRRVLSQVLPPMLQAGFQGINLAADSARQMLRVYLELRALRERLFQSPLLLEQGNLSSAALADALRRSCIPVPVPTPTPSPRDAVTALRVEEATLRRTLRAFGRGAASRDSLLIQAGRALRARDAVTQACVRGLGAPTLQSFSAVLGSHNPRSLSGWTSALARVGITPRTIAVAALEAAPALATGFAVTLTVARKLATWCAQHIRKQILTLDRQHEGRQ